MTVTVPNQWSGTFAQPVAFGPVPPALQSAVIALTPATSVGGGSGTPTAGNWLFCIAGWNQAALPAATIAAADDIHSFWRPGQVVTASWPGNTASGSAAVSAASGSTRTSVWYTPNLVRVPGDVYAAPASAVAGMAVLVIEVAGLGPWDTVTGVYTNYAAAATSLNLALGAPSAQAFLLGAVTGDSTAAGQAFAPGGWMALSAVSASNGSDHTDDAVLTSAWITTGGSVSVNGTASSATDLSGVLVGVLTAAASPVPAAHNPNWPLVRFEAAFGGGYQTPPDQLAWTDLSSRLWSWDETTGIQYEFGEVQSTDLNVELDNFDQNLSSDWPGALYYSNALNRNMSFQSGAAPWAAWGGSSLALSSAHAYASSAGAAATFSLAVTPNGTTANPGATSEYVPVTGSTAYTVSGWVTAPAGWATGWQCSAIWYDSSKTFISFGAGSTPLAVTSAWQQVSNTLTSPSNAAFMILLFQAAGTPPGSTVFYLAECAAVAGSVVVATGLITSGTPVRIRAAVGTAGGHAVNRWYVISRNAAEWPQQIMDIRRQYVPATGSDIWAVTSSSCRSPYRGEVFQDAPYAWWPCDDQPLAGGVQPVSLRNIAPGNSSALSITASPGGITAQDAYGTNNTDLSAFIGAFPNPPPPGIAIYSAGQNQGWMYGDPASSLASAAASGGPVTASPGAASWQHSGILGNTGQHGWFLDVNDAAFPGLSGGVTVEGWFLYPFWAGDKGFTGPVGGIGGGNQYNVYQQPDAPMSLLELATASAPVAILQMDTSGHLSLITYNGGTGTSQSVYTTSDLRCNSWFHVAVTLTATTWAVYVNGGLTATASGSATISPAAWTWLIVNGDLGTGGGSTLSGITHSASVAVSHIAVYPKVLTIWRILAHYSAAISAFGALPAPASVQLSQVSNAKPTGFTPDGSSYKGTYGWVNATTLSNYTFSAEAAAVAGAYTSGPSSRATIAGQGVNAAQTQGQAVWVTWQSIAPLVQVFTAATPASETEAAACLGSGDSFTSGYGSGASGHGVSQVSAGTGASPPAAASALGDTVQQRLERILAYGQCTYPGRCIDPASQLVQAATDVGGQSAGANLQNIAQSDGGMLFIDNCGNITYWSRTHLASQYASPVWTLGPGATPYMREIDWKADPHRVWNTISITPFSPSGASLPVITPRSAAAVTASQAQYGAQPFQQVNYLQSATEQQNLADWILATFGGLRIRADSIDVDAATYPAAWPLVLGGNVGDIATVQNWQVGAGGITGTFRVTQIHRRLVFGGMSGDVRAEITLTTDFEPTSYWT